MPHCNNTLANEHISEIPIWHGYTFHEFGLVLSAIFGLIALIIASFLILMHATHYLKPYEQRHIIRILFLIPVYSVVSFLSYYYYLHAIYWDILEGCYEAFAISSFFTLLCHYIAPNLHDQKEYFRAVKPKNWFWGVFGLQKCTGGENKGPFRKPRSGLTWFNVSISLENFSCDANKKLGRLDRRFPILLHSRLLHHRGSRHSNRQRLLPGQP